MREFKFRAWRITSCDLVDVRTIDWDEKFIAHEDLSFTSYPNEPAEPECITEFKDCILLQYTELKDKDGKEIYEGDLLIHNGNQNAIYEIFYNDDSAKYDNCRVHYRGNQCGGYLPPLTSNGFKIIGNIYENPELLEKQE